MSASARIRLTVEIDLSDAWWGDDWKLEDVMKSAGDRAITIVQSKTPFRIVGTPEVTVIMVKKP